MYINIYLYNNALYLYSFSKLIITYQSWYDHHFSLLWLYTFSNLNVTYNRKYMSYKHLGQRHHLFIFSLILTWVQSYFYLENHMSFSTMCLNKGFFFFFFWYKILHANGFPDILFLWCTNFLYMVPNPTLIKPLTST